MSLTPRRSGPSARPVAPITFRPSPEQVDGLIDEAARHPLGLEFLTQGELGAVAATFGAHAFTVDAARRVLAARREN